MKELFLFKGLLALERENVTSTFSSPVFAILRAFQKNDVLKKRERLLD